MVVTDHPGCRGAAARLPKKPGTQKLTPPSSASTALGAAIVPRIRAKPPATAQRHAPPLTLRLRILVSPILTGFAHRIHSYVDSCAAVRTPSHAATLRDMFAAARVPAAPDRCRLSDI